VSEPSQLIGQLDPQDFRHLAEVPGWKARISFIELIK